MTCHLSTGAPPALPPTPPEWRPKCLCIDADGVLHRGRTPLPGAAMFLSHLSTGGFPFRIVTNNSRQRGAESAAHFRGLGLPVAGDAVLTAAEAMALYAREHAPTSEAPRVFVLGEADLRSTLRAGGCRVVRENPDFVAVGLDRRFSYDRLARASQAAVECGRLLVANLDATIPRENGDVPGVGALVAALACTSGLEPIVAGKPAPTMFDLAVKAMGFAPSDALAIGDRLDSDVLGAARAGVRSALILTGSHGRDDIASAEAAPQFVFENLTEFERWLLG
jgi:4-nitrophenyl phosphatase